MSKQPPTTRQKKGRKTSITTLFKGVVTKVMRDQAEITFQTPTETLKQTYNKAQFDGKILPCEGDHVRARITITLSPPKKATPL